MKKKFTLLFTILFVLGLFASCKPKASDNSTLRIAGLTGPTSMGLVRLMEQNENKESLQSYEFTLAGSADEVTPKLIRGEYDLAAVPANLASVLYNNTDGAIVVLAVNTLGVLYLLERGNSVTDWVSLKGKTIYASGKGSTPEYTLRYLLSANGLDPDKDLTLEFRSEPAEVVSLISQNPDAVAMLPQPYVTVAMGKVQDLHMVMDLTKEWNKTNNNELITGVLVARKDFAEAHPEAIQTFLNEYEASVRFALDQIDETAALCERFGIVKETIAKAALPYCNLTFLSGKSMKETLSAYLTVLYNQNPKAVGGKLPESDFYYE